jgi:hypothetical protein
MHLMYGKLVTVKCQVGDEVGLLGPEVSAVHELPCSTRNAYLNREDLCML